jgi:hypothetical protein
MPLYPLCIIRSRDVPSASEEEAIGCPAVEWSCDGELACAFVEAPHDGFQPLQHAAALEAIYRRVGVLPMRFGAAMHDESEIRSLLQTRRDELLERLDRLAGTCEFGLRITLPAPVSSHVRQTPGRPVGGPDIPVCQPSVDSSDRQECLSHRDNHSAQIYLERRRSHYQDQDAAGLRADQVVKQLVERLQGTHRQWRRLPSPSPQVVRLALLVEHDQVDGFRSRLAGLGTECSEGRCVVLGPWPPYSFV